MSILLFITIGCDGSMGEWRVRHTAFPRGNVGADCIRPLFEMRHKVRATHPCSDARERENHN